MKTYQKLINLKEEPLSLKEAKAKLLTLTIKNPIFWLKAITLIVGIVIFINFLLSMTIESLFPMPAEETGTLASFKPFTSLNFILAVIWLLAVLAVIWAIDVIIETLKLLKSLNPIGVSELEKIINVAKEDTVVKRYTQKALAQRDYLYLAEYRAIKDRNEKKQLTKREKEQEAQQKNEQAKKRMLYLKLNRLNEGEE